MRFTNTNQLQFISFFKRGGSFSRDGSRGGRHVPKGKDGEQWKVSLITNMYARCLWEDTYVWTIKADG